MSAIVVMIILFTAAAAKAQVGWTVGKFAEKFPDSTATMEMANAVSMLIRGPSTLHAMRTTMSPTLSFTGLVIDQTPLSLAMTWINC
jgi:hypothetical protein